MLTVSSVVSVGLLRGPESGLTAGALIGFIFLTYRFLEPIAEFTEVIDQTQTAVAGLRRVLGVLEIPIGPPEPPASGGACRPDGWRRHRARHVRVPVARRRRRATGPDRRHRAHPGRPAGRRWSARPARARPPSAGWSPAWPTRRPASSGWAESRWSQVANDELRERLVVVPQEPFLFDGTIATNLGFARPMLSIARHRAGRHRSRAGRLAGRAAGRHRHRGRSARRWLVGRRTPAGGAGASIVGRSRCARARRSDVVGRRPDRGAPDARARQVGGRPHDHLHRPPPVHRGPRRSGAGARARSIWCRTARTASLVEREGPYARMYESWVASTTSGQ